MNYEKKTVYCPKCGRKVATWDGKVKTPVVSRCNKCIKRVVFNPETKKTEIKKIPPRNTGSGMVFI